MELTIECHAIFLGNSTVLFRQFRKMERPNEADFVKVPSQCVQKLMKTQVYLKVLWALFVWQKTVKFNTEISYM